MPETNDTQVKQPAEKKPAPSAPSAAPATSGETVTVYCKLPHGIRYNLPSGEELRFVGALGDERSQLQVSGLAGRDSVAGFGVTKNVSVEAWAWVVEKYGKDAAHRNGLIFAHEKEKSGSAEAKEKADEKTGFEPIDPSKDPNNDKEGNKQNLGGGSAPDASA
ncbi:hypothetical protein BCh11DRAFT_06472 [Burkholderia sp. Ch1-1]|nr:hypothetical protein BCh11DRAFT_06472 [Burkholderia sp. Ch1-1]